MIDHYDGDRDHRTLRVDYYSIGNIKRSRVSNNNKSKIKSISEGNLEIRKKYKFIVKLR